MRFLTFFYLSFLTVFSNTTVVKASLFDALPKPDLQTPKSSPVKPLQSVQEIVESWDGSRTWMTEGRALLFDTETTGVTAYDRIVQISVYEIVNGKFTGKTFNSYVNPCRSVSARAYKAHHLKNSYLKKQPKFSDIFDSLRDFCGEKPLLVAHNAQFDIRMLEQEIARLEAVEPWQVYFKCTLGMVRRDYKRSIKPEIDIISPLKQRTLKPVSYYQRQKQRREKEAKKIQKLWEKEKRYGIKIKSSSQEDRDKRAKKRESLKRSRDQMENQENVSPNSQTSDSDDSDSSVRKQKRKKKKLSSHPSFALSSVLGRLDTSPKRAVKKHGYSLPKICKSHGVPPTRWDYHDALWDTGGLVGLMDSLSSSDSSQPSSPKTEEEENPFSLFIDEEDELDTSFLDDNGTKNDEPFVIHSIF